MKSLKNKADVAQRQRMARRQLSTDFLDHALEWRRIFAEAWGRSCWSWLLTVAKSTTWIYVVGPAIGALIGVIFEWILKGRPTAAGAIAAQGGQHGDDSTNA